MDNETKQTLNGLLSKEDNAAYEEAMQKIVDRYNITEENRHPAKEIRAIGKSILDHENEMVKGVRFNNQLYYPEGGIVSFNQTSDTTTYAIRLASTLSGDRNIKVGDDLQCDVRYMAIQITPLGDRLNYKAVPGTLTVDVQKDGSSEWVNKYIQNNVISQDEEYNAELPSSYPVSVNIGQYCEEGLQNIRIRVSSYYVDENGIQRSFYGDLFYSVNAVNLVVKNMTDWSQRILASDGGFPFSFSVMGAVEKQLHVTMTGSLGTWEMTPKVFSANEQKPENNPYSWTQAEIPAYGLLTHGVHTVTAWLTCSDGMGGTLSSDVVVNRFMVVDPNTAGDKLLNPFLMLQQVQSVVTNYVRTEISNFAVWIPKSESEPTMASTEPLSVSIRITNAGDGDFDYTEEYFNSEQRVYSGTRYSIDTTIEIENSTDGEAPASYQAYLRVFRYDSDETINFMRESIGSRFVVFTVDNKNDYSPVAGAHFYLNPKVRNNTESDWKSIINHQNQEVVPSEWSGFGGVNDGWVSDDNGVRVLRILAGQRLNIGYEPWSAFLSNPSSSMTLEVDFAVHNITDEDNPVINISQEVDGQRIGFVLKPLTGALWTIGNQTENDQDFGFEEDVRTHMVITINPALVARSSDEFKWQTPNGTESNRPTAKVYINGKHKRAIQYSVETSGAWIQGEGHGGITLGNDNCDLDIYSVRCYRGTALSAQAVVQNYIASRPTAEEKNKIREENDILDGNGRVSYSKVYAKGKRCLTLVGTDNYKINQDKKTGYPCYWKIDYFDNNGVYVPELSGTIGKSSYEAYLAGELNGKKCLMNTAQGSTANTYWWNNEQTKCDKISYVINIPFNTVHEDFGWKPSMSDFTEESAASNPMYLNGEQIQGSDYSALTDTDKEKVTIDVIDGWIDGNGMYHGQFYTSAKGAAKATKLVNKINYASPMQSHKMGATRLYNDVMKGITGGMPHMETNPSARFAVLEDSFFFFNQPEGYNTPIFIGMSTFGQGKCDKPSWGYDKKKMCAFEGLNNNLPLCDFRVPADEDVVYVPDEEAYVYNGVNSFEYSLGATKDDGSPTDVADAAIRRYINFIYTHDIRMEYYSGSRSEFESFYSHIYDQATIPGAPTEATQLLEKVQTTKYWLRDGSEAFHLLRFNFVTKSWVDAGIWDDETKSYKSGVRDLSKDAMTKDAYEAWAASSDLGDYSALNTRFKLAIAKHFNDNCDCCLNKQNHMTHYNLVNFLLAGTDNCSKNTYYTVDLSAGGIVWLFQDDLDTILTTDNNGRQTKVYFLSRYFDVQDYENGYKKQKDYEGTASALFNVMEMAWETLDSTALAENMRSVLTVMSGLVNANDVLDGLTTSQKQTPLGCIHKYLFSIQKYFPAMAYNEQQRIRYDYPASWGYVSYGNQARGIPALTQGIGDQLESEMQYMKRRLALVCSYAAWGEFSSGVNTGSTGLEDASGAFSLTPGSGNAGGDYIFEVKPHQFIYPCGVRDRALINPHVRVAPGESYKLVVATAGNSVSGDSSVGLSAVNYYRSIGNVGNMVSGNNSIAVQGKRLVEFIAEPTQGSTAFAPKALSIEAPNIEKLSLNGLTTISGTMSLTKLSRLRYLNLTGTKLNTVRLPETSFLEYARFGANLTSLDVRNMPNLTDCLLGGHSMLRSVTMLNVGFDTKNIVSGMYSEKAQVELCNVDGIEWDNVSPEMLMYLSEIPTCNLYGKITVTSGQNVSAKLKMTLLKKFGNIDDSGNSIYIVYTFRSATSVEIITKRFIISEAGEYLFEADILPSSANNFTSLKWSISENPVGATVDDNTGIVSVGSVGEESENPKATLTATLNLLSGAKLSNSIDIKLFNRIPKLGDFAYSDGQFDSVLYYGKEVVGWVYKVTHYKDLPTEVLNEYLKDEELKTQYESGANLYEVLVESKENIRFKTSDNATEFSNNVWGIYKQDIGESGFTSEELSEISNPLGISESQLIDIPNIQNITKPGLFNESGETSNYITDVCSYDDSKEDGFVVYDDNTAASQWNGRRKTAEIVAHAKNILQHFVGEGYLSNESGQTIWDYINADHILPNNLNELADLLVGLSNLGGGDRYKQLAYPAAYSCVLFEPKDSVGNAITDLNQQYSRGKWYLSDSADRVRLYIFFRNSRALKPADTGTPTAAFSDENNPERPLEPTDARRPYYANLLKRSADANRICPITLPTQGHSWSSCEGGSSTAWYIYFSVGSVFSYYKYGSFVVRPVVAFTFKF